MHTTCILLLQEPIILTVAYKDKTSSFSVSKVQMPASLPPSVLLSLSLSLFPWASPD